MNVNAPREGNRPDPFAYPTTPVNPEEPRHSLVRKIESGLAEPRRDSLRNRCLANRNGWSEEEYWHWVDSGDPPQRQRVNETAKPPVNSADDERLYDY